MRDYWLSKLFFDLQTPAAAAEYRTSREAVLARYPQKPEVRAAIAANDVAALAPWNRLLAEREGGVTRVPGYDLFCQLIKCSACIGLLPHYAAQLDRGLLALPQVLEAPMRRTVWLAVHEASAQTALVQVLVTMIRAAFDERREWF